LKSGTMVACIIDYNVYIMYTNIRIYIYVCVSRPWLRRYTFISPSLLFWFFKLSFLCPEADVPRDSTRGRGIWINWAWGQSALGGAASTGIHVLQPWRRAWTGRQWYRCFTLIGRDNLWCIVIVPIISFIVYIIVLCLSV
jgi:hypothetical protein